MALLHARPAKARIIIACARRSCVAPYVPPWLFAAVAAKKTARAKISAIIFHGMPASAEVIFRTIHGLPRRCHCRHNIKSTSFRWHMLRRQRRKRFHCPSAKGVVACAAASRAPSSRARSHARLPPRTVSTITSARGLCENGAACRAACGRRAHEARRQRNVLIQPRRWYAALMRE